MKFSSFLFAAAMALTSAANAADGPAVTIQKFAFTPKELTITPGTKVVWTNADETPHTVATSDKQFMSKAMDTGDKFEFTFANEGDFSYFCTLHPFMTGTIHVHK